MLPYVQPILLVKHKIRHFLINAALYLAVLLRSWASSPRLEPGITPQNTAVMSCFMTWSSAAILPQISLGCHFVT